MTDTHVLLLQRCVLLPTNLAAFMVHHFQLLGMAGLGLYRGVEGSIKEGGEPTVGCPGGYFPPGEILEKDGLRCILVLSKQI